MDAPGPGQPTVEMDALDLLTEDCWKEVFQRVPSAQDLKSCNEACLIFEEILGKKKNQFMFGLVLSHLFDYQEDYEPLLDRNELLKCRLVCKRWTKSIDYKYKSRFKTFYHFRHGMQIERFLQMYANHHGNPFLGRSVSLAYCGRLLLGEIREEDPDADPDELDELAGYEEEENFRIEQLRVLLARFGNEIWAVDLNEGFEDTHLAFCKSIQIVLSQMSNLHTFRLRCVSAAARNKRGEMSELPAYIAANPLPDLPQLEAAEIASVSGVMVRPILEKYAPQLKSLGVRKSSDLADHVVRLGNLKKLELTGLDPSSSLDCLRQLQSPLENLSLKMCGQIPKDKGHVWAIEQLFRNIQHLPVQFLKITAWGVFLGESEPISAEQRPRHGSISSMNVFAERDKTSLNFLLYCPNLESVSFELQNGYPAGHPNNGVVESLDVLDMLKQADYDLYQSNVWEQIPTLKSLAVSWDENYDRARHDRRRLRNGRQAVEEQ